MDKQEYREIVSDIRRAYDQAEYDKVLMYADELDMRKVSDSRVLEMIADSHRALGQPETAKDLLLKAYEKTPMGRKLAYKLSELSIQLDDLDGAVDFYEDFCKMAPNDNDRFLLKYKIGKAGGVPQKELAKVLAAYCSREVDEKWMAELAGIYDEIGETDKCNEVCDDIILWYADGVYVQKALELKSKNGGLTASQQTKLEEIQAAEQAPVQTFPEEEEERQLRPGSMEPEQLTEEDLDSILEEYITIEDATAPPEPVKEEDMAEALNELDDEIDFVDISEPETEVIPVEEIRAAAEEDPVEAAEEITEAKAEAAKAAAIEAHIAGADYQPQQAKAESEILDAGPILEELELQTAPVHEEVQERIAENIGPSVQEDVPDILAVPVVEEPEPIPQPVVSTGRRFSNIEAMQSARTAPPKEEQDFWKMPEELTYEEEPVAVDPEEPVYGSHRWFEEQPEVDYEEPVYGSHRYVPQPPQEEYEDPEAANVVIEQVEPEPLVIEQAEEEMPEHISTIRTTSSGAELLGMYAAAKATGSAGKLSEQAALVKKPALGGKKTIPADLFADPITEPEYYEGPSLMEAPAAAEEVAEAPEAEEGVVFLEDVTQEPEKPELSAVEALFAEEPEVAAVEEEPAAAPEEVFLPFEEPGADKISAEPEEKEVLVQEFIPEAEAEAEPEAEYEEIPEVDEEEIFEQSLDAFGDAQRDEEGTADFEERIEEYKEEHLADIPEEVAFDHQPLFDDEEAVRALSPEEPAAAEDDAFFAEMEDEIVGVLAAEGVAEEAPAEEPAEPEEAEAKEPAAEDAPAEEAEEEEAAAEEPARPLPFMFRVMPHEPIAEVVPDIIKEREEQAKKEAEEAAAAAAAAALAAAAPAPAAVPAEPAYDDVPEVDEDEVFERAVDDLTDAQKDEEGTADFEDRIAAYKEEHLADVPEELNFDHQPLFDDEAAQQALMPETAAEEPETETAPEPESAPSIFIPLNRLAAEEPGKIITPVTEKTIAAEEAAEYEQEYAPAFDAAIFDELFEGEPEEPVLEEEVPVFEEEAFEEAVPEEEFFEEEAPVEEEAAPEVMPEAESLPFLAASVAAMMEEPEEPAFEEEPAAEVEDSEFDRAVQEFEMVNDSGDAADWQEEYELATPQTEEAPLEEITSPIPKIEEAVEEAPELSDFEKAMLAFDAEQEAAQAEDFSEDEFTETLDEVVDEAAVAEPWAEPEFGLPNFEGSEFAKPAFLGNDFDAEEEYVPEEPIAEEVPEEVPEVEEPELSGFEKALRAFEQENREEPTEPLFEEPSIEEPAEEAAPEEEYAEEIAAAPETPAYEIPEDLRGELSEFLLIDGMEKRICDTIGNIIAIKRGGDPTGGHLIMTGDAKSGKTYLTISIIKAVGKEIGNTTGRVAKVQAEALNGKDINKVLRKIAGSDLIIENAGYLKDETAERLAEAMKASSTGSMIVLEGNRLGVENILTKHPELESCFASRMDLDELTLSQWADLACD